MVTQAELLNELRSDAQSVVDQLGALSPEQLERGAYEQDWTVRDLVAHLSSIEWTYPRLIAQAAQAQDEPAAQPAEGQAESD